MEPKMISSELTVEPQQNVFTKVMVGSSKNYERIPEPADYYERPLMVNTWSQTTNADFSYLNAIEQKHQQSQREKELEEKIRVLEVNLKAYSELLSQIHETSARTALLLGQQKQPPRHLTPPPLYPKVPGNSEAESSQSIQYSSVIHKNPPKISPKLVNNALLHYSPSNSVINPLQQVGSSSADSIKYTIIAEGTGDHNYEPIEVTLAEDDGALNLNSSADSGRLEICLEPEDNVEVKTELNPSQNSNQNIPPVPTPSEHHFIKRRKLAVEQHEVLPSKSNYFFNDQGVLTPSSGNSNCIQQQQQQQQQQHQQQHQQHHQQQYHQQHHQQQYHQQHQQQHHQQQYHQQQKQKRRSSNSLLKTPKIENTNDNSSYIQTTSFQSLMPSPNTSITSQRGTPSTTNHTGPDNVMISIGPNNTRIPAKLYENMNWSSASLATRKLLMAIFDRQTLATHSMTGKPSPAFKDHGKPLKQMLDPHVIADIIFAVTRKCNVSDKEVRNAITTKCADENKMMKLQMNKRTPMREMNKENIMG